MPDTVPHAATAGDPVHVAIVGSGPSAFYAAEALLRAVPTVRVDMLERLPTPFGLVRGGVAPDHPKIKQVALVYDRIARSPGFRFFGNVTVGRDVGVDELRGAYHAVVFACGATFDRSLDIPGESLAGSHAAGEFVGWYNGHPDHAHREFDLSHEVAVVIGQGNVAADLARMLLTPPEALAGTDIAEHALQTLSRSRVREVHIVGRRGPAQMKFTNNELRELGWIPGCQAVVDARDLELNDASRAEIAERRAEVAAKNLEILRGYADRPITEPKRCYFRFLETPLAIGGAGHVEKIVFAKNRLEGAPFRQLARRTAETVELPCGLVLRSVGFHGTPLPGVPFDTARGVFSNREGRVYGDGAPVPGLYATGWIKRGPVGVIGTNRADSVETVKSLLDDLPALRGAPRAGAASLEPALAARGVRVVGYADWLMIDAAEVSRGRGKPREKFTRIDDMLAALAARTSTAEK